MPKVLFIAYYFPPVGGSGVLRAQKFVQYLPQEGFLPTVVAGPAALEGRWGPSDPTLSATVPPNIEVYRVDARASVPAGRLQRRLGRWLGLPGSFAKWWIRSATELASRAANGADLIFATMSPFESAEVASELSPRLDIPWVADLRDPWALDDIELYPTLLHRKLEMGKMEKLLSSAALIVMNTPDAARALKAALPRLRNKEVLAITNGFDAKDFAGTPEPRSDSKFRIVHAGGMFTGAGFQLRRRRFYQVLGGVVPGVDILGRSPVILLEALERWSARRPEIKKDLELVFAGKIAEEDQALVTRSTMASLIRFTGFLPHADSLQLIRTADLLFLPMHNLPPGKRCLSIPGKTYEYMASGRPILAAVPDGDGRDFLSQCGTALLCRPDDASGMIQILDRVYSAWKRREPVPKMNQDFVQQFERRNLTRMLARAFCGLLKNAPQRDPSYLAVPEQIEPMLPSY